MSPLNDVTELQKVRFLMRLGWCTNWMGRGQT